MTDPLSRLTRVEDIRAFWPSESRDFTPWLAEEDNLALLAETLGYGADGFALEGREVNVGPFFADILCRDTNTPEGDRVLIENQYGRTDHDHLGKLITYASGLKAKTVVIIAEDLRPEHRAALDWLNAISSDDYRFFGVTLELYRIGDSPAAPQFNVIVSPNDWARDVALPGGNKELSETQQFYLDYWKAMAAVMTGRDTRLKSRKAFPSNWTGFGIGRVDFELNLTLQPKERWIRAELTLFGPLAKGYLRQLENERAEIEAELGFLPEWDYADHRKGAKLAITRPDTDPNNRQDWPRQHAWLADHVIKLHTVLHDRVRRLDKDAAEVL